MANEATEQALPIVSEASTAASQPQKPGRVVATDSMQPAELGEVTV